MKKHKKIRWFRIGAVLFVGLFVYFALMIPEKENQLSELEEQYASVDSAYLTAQEELNRVRDELDHIEDTEVIERLARRESDCGWMGEIVYDIENLNAIRAELYPEK